MKSTAFNHPEYYKPENGTECIDAMIQQFGIDETANFCLLNAFKYLWRCMAMARPGVAEHREAMAEH